MLISLLYIIYSSIFRGELYLWKVDIDNKPVYLLGSIHAFKPELYPLIDPKIMDAFNSADLVLFENIAYFKRRYWLEDGRILKDYIPEPYYSEISDALKSKGFDIEEYSLYRPFDFLFHMSYVMSGLYGYGSYFDDGIDLYFSRLRSSRRIRSGSLEPIYYYFDLMEKHMPKDLAAFYISKTVKSFADDGEIRRKELEKGMYNWLNCKDIQTMAMIDFNLSYISDDNSEKKLKLFDILKNVHCQRNLAMADSIERYAISKGNKVIFAMAGVSHLIGENNIIEILRKKGYKAKRIKRSWVLPF